MSSLKRRTHSFPSSSFLSFSLSLSLSLSLASFSFLLNLSVYRLIYIYPHIKAFFPSLISPIIDNRTHGLGPTAAEHIDPALGLKFDITACAHIEQLARGSIECVTHGLKSK